MSNFEKAMELLSENKFSEALIEFESLKENESDPNQESVLSHLIKVKKILNKTTAADQIDLAEIMIQKRKYKDAIVQLESIDSNQSFSKKRWLYLMYKSYSKSGLIQDALRLGKKYVDELLSLKKYHILEAFLPELVEEVGAIKIAEKLEVQSKIAHGEIEELGEKYSGILKDFSEGKELNFELIQYIQDSLSARGRVFGKTPLYKATRVVSSFYPSIEPDGQWDRKKRIINEIFDGVLSESESPVYFRILVKYATSAKRKDLAYSTVEYMIQNKDKMGIKRGEYKKLVSLSEEIITWDEDLDKEVNYDDLDMGTDLFKEYNDGSNIFQKIKKLERDIDFLKTTGNEEEIQALLEELRELDDEHTLVKELNEQKSKDEASRFKGKKKGLDDVKDDLLEQIERFTLKSGDEDLSQKFDRNLSVQVVHLEETIFSRNKMDLVVALMEMDLFSAALRCLERNVPSDEDINNKMNYLNLKVQLLKESGKIHEALDICQETIAKYPLTDDEKINFVYMEGELARLMKKNRQAVAAYQWVDTIQPGYRLVKQRLREFEQS